MNIWQKSYNVEYPFIVNDNARKLRVRSLVSFKDRNDRTFRNLNRSMQLNYLEASQTSGWMRFWAETSNKIIPDYFVDSLYHNFDKSLNVKIQRRGRFLLRSTVVSFSLYSFSHYLWSSGYLGYFHDRLSILVVFKYLPRTLPTFHRSLLSKNFE